jgi:hypothetical protein
MKLYQQLKILINKIKILIGGIIMKKVATLEIWVDEKLEDAIERANVVYTNAFTHEYISDGSVELRVVEGIKNV